MVTRMGITTYLKRNHLEIRVIIRKISRGRIKNFINNIRIPKMETKVSETMVKGFHTKEAIKIHQETNFLNKRKLLEMDVVIVVKGIMQISTP